MPFRQETFAPVAPNSADVPRFWSYKTTDFLAEILLPGYFAPKRFQLETTDFIWVIAADARRVIRYNGEILPPEIIAPKPPLQVLLGVHESNQGPTALDTVHQVKFGPLQGDPALPVNLSAAGTVVINQDGVYSFRAVLTCARTDALPVDFASATNVRLFFNVTLNGDQIDNVRVVDLLLPGITVSVVTEAIISVKQGDQFIVNMARDSFGINEGELVSATPTVLINAGTSASALVRVAKLV